MQGVEIPIWTADHEFIAMARVDAHNRSLVASLVLYEGDDHPSVKPVVGRTTFLHFLIFDAVRERCLAAGLPFPKGYEKPRQPGYELHHKNFKKFDARESNLELLTETEHKRLSLRKRQRIDYRERDNLGSSWWRRHTPAPVKRDISIINEKERQLSSEQIQRRGEQALRRPWHRTLSPEEILAETSLAPLLAAHRVALRHWEEPGSKIPPMRWTKQNRGTAPLPLPRLGCWPGEVTFVMCLVASGFDMDRVSRCLRQPLRILAAMRERPAVQNAIVNWQKYRRWPTPCPPNGGYSLPVPPPMMQDVAVLHQDARPPQGARLLGHQQLVLPLTPASQRSARSRR